MDYPKTLPIEALNTLLAKLRGNASNSEAVHAAWLILGYGLHIGIPVDSVFGGAEVQLKEETALEALIHESELGDDVAGGPLTGIAISIVIKLALRLLKEAIE